MPVSGGGFQQCYNAQASVDTDTRLVMSTQVTQVTNDMQQLVAALNDLMSLPAALGNVTDRAADNGYFGAGNVGYCAAHQVRPLIALWRDSHHPCVFDRFAPDSQAPDTDNPLMLMKHSLTTQAGRALYGLRKARIRHPQARHGLQAILTAWVG